MLRQLIICLFGVQKWVGIIDRVGGLINEEGFSHNTITELFKFKDGNALASKDLIPFEEINEKIWDLQSEVFLPCAASRLIQRDQVDRMINSGIEVVACGANVPFADKEIFMGPISEYADDHISIIPDFIANCGMARVFAYLMETGEVDMSDSGIFEDTSKTIRNGMLAVHKINPGKTKIAKTGLEIALKKLV